MSTIISSLIVVRHFKTEFLRNSLLHLLVSCKCICWFLVAAYVGAYLNAIKSSLLSRVAGVYKSSILFLSNCVVVLDMSLL